MTTHWSHHRVGTRRAISGARMRDRPRAGVERKLGNGLRGAGAALAGHAVGLAILGAWAVLSFVLAVKRFRWV